MTHTEEIEAALRAGPLKCWDAEKHPMMNSECRPQSELPCWPCRLRPAVAAYIAKREEVRQSIYEDVCTERDMANSYVADVSALNDSLRAQVEELRSACDAIGSRNAESLELVLAAMGDAPYNGEPLTKWIKALAAERDSLRTQLAKAIADGACDACAGTGVPISGRTCMCNGTGKASEAVNTLRAQLADRDRLIAEREDVWDATTEEISHYMQTLTARDQRIKWLIAQIKALSKRLVEMLDENTAQRNQLAERDREVELLREVERIVRVEGRYQPGSCESGAIVLYQLDRYRAAQADARGGPGAGTKEEGNK